MNIPREYIDCWGKWDFVVGVILFIVMGLIATYFQWKYYKEKKKNKLIINNLHDAPNSTKSEKSDK